MEEQPKVQYYNTAGTATLQPIIKTIKIDARVWDSLKSLKKENETFNDVIKELLQQRTKALGDDNINAIKYKRELIFFTIYVFGKEIGVEAEYNGAKGNKSDFVFDLQIKKMFYGKRQFNPSEFFGVDNAHKHYSDIFIRFYLDAIRVVLGKEFKVSNNLFALQDIFNIAIWRKLYYDYSLSEESFKQDIEEPLRLSEEDEPSTEWLMRIYNSILFKSVRQNQGNNKTK